MIRSLVFVLACVLPQIAAADEIPVRVLFLGDNGPHHPAERFRQLQPVLAKRGIELTYSERAGDLNPQTLAAYDGLLVYANIERIERDQERALLDYVAGGKGFIPIHCASFCFQNSPRYVELVGAQFQRHGTGVFRTTLTIPNHPVVEGFASFESWDETYVHHRHNDGGRTILESRTDGDRKEPWTWVRTHGKGRVFYTAWGHDDRTWGHAGFHNLVERGIRWSVGADPSVVLEFSDRPEMTPQRTDVKPPEYTEAKVPFYPAGERWGTTGEPITKMQRPLPADESLKHFVTPVGFEVRLFAAEPEVGGKPICMNWDERGRLWIAETVDYPNELLPPGQGRDRIRICEDTDGDGQADKFTVFAEKLSIPTSLTFAYGGVIVHQAPDTLFLKDTDGDDKADERRVLFTGWSTRDTHAGPSNLQYGFDNWFYGIVGYSGFEGEIGGEQQSFRQGFYRFKVDDSPTGPQVTKCEFLRGTNNNSWGVGFSEEGILFGSTANGNPSEYMPVPNRFYEQVRGWSSSVLEGIALDAEYDPITSNVRQVDHHGRFTSAAGHALYTARAYPREYWNRTAFVSDPTGHLTATFVIQPNGSGFRSRNAWNLLASDDEWSAPIMAEVGPDGQVWVIDWYNYIVQHNPTPAGYQTGKGNAYETDLRDKKHGRIYRIVHVAEGGSSPAARSSRAALDGADPASLVAALKDDNMFWRRHAQRLLVERGELDVLPALIDLIRDTELDEIGLNPGAIHALWTMHGLGAIDGLHREAAAASFDALKHPSAGVRRNAVMVLPRNERGRDALLAAGLLGDNDGQVKLAALLALAEMPASEGAASAIAALLRDRIDARDRWLDDAAASAAAKNDAHFLRVVASAGGAPVAEALGAVGVVAEHYARSAPEAEAVASLLPRLSQAPLPAAEAVIAGLARGWPRDAPLSLDGQAESALGELISRLSPAGRSQLVALASRWGTTALERYAAEISARLLEQASNSDARSRERLAAARQLIEFRRSDSAPAGALLDLITPRASPELAQGLLQAVALSEAGTVGPAIIERLPSLTPSVRSLALGSLLSRAEWTIALIEAAEQRSVQIADLSLDQKQALLAHPDRAIAERARKLFSAGGGLPNPDRQKVLEELMPLAGRPGDPVAGKAVFQKQCAKCHTHNGEGTKVGPDLTGMAVHPKHELLTQIIDPGRSVEGNYRAYTLVTAEGRVFTGLLASETRTSVELYDSEGKRHAIQREDIEELLASSKSLMPEGFEKQISQTELVDLLAFLAQRGRFLPLPIEKAATVVTTRPMFYGRDNAERLVFSDWSPKTVDGVPFQLVDPNGDRTPNAILLYGPNGTLPPRMPRSVSVPCNAPARAIHLLSGVSGWGFPLGEKGSVSMIVRLHYAGRETEDHELKNGIHFADYIRRVDVPESEFAFNLRGRQLRYLSIRPERPDVIEKIEFIKGSDNTSPVVMAATVEVGEPQ